MGNDHRRVSRDSSSGAEASAASTLPGRRSLSDTPTEPEPSAAPVQRKAGGPATGHDVHAAARHGISGSGGPLPFLDLIQRSFGKHDVGGIQAHTGEAAAQAGAAMGASAYATGDRVAFAGAPDLHTAAHEAAHVVQQRAGVQLSGGVGEAGDAYERGADAVADRVVRGESAEDLLGGGTTSAPAGAPAGAAPVQRRTSRDTDEAAPAPTETGLFKALHDTFLHREIGRALRPTTIIIRAGMVVREKPAPASSAAHPAHRHIANAGEVFGWIPKTDLSPLPPDLAPASDPRIGEGTPDPNLPAIGVDQYDDLVVLRGDTPVHQSPDATSAQLALATRMETVIYLPDAPITVERTTWRKVHLLRQAPIEGWIKPGNGVRVEPGVSSPGALTGNPMLSVDAGSEGEDVLALQQALAALGLDPGPADGVYTAQTAAAVKELQERTGATPDGVFGPESAEALVRLQRGEGGAGEPWIPTGTWRTGYRLKSRTPGRALTPDGGRAREVHGKTSQGGAVYIPAGPVEVLMAGSAPASCIDRSADPDRPDGTECWFVRGAVLRDEADLDNTTTTGGAGWVALTTVEETGAGEATGGVADELAQLCPNGITVAFVVNFADREGRSFTTFLSEGSQFAQAQHGVAVSGGQIVTGVVNLITHKRDVVGILAGIQQALRGGTDEVPTWARVAHLAFFTHGYTEGIETDADGYYDSADDGVLRPKDLDGFSRTLTAFCTSDVKVSLFSCSTGATNEETSGMWAQQDAAKAGEGSFADNLSDSLAEAGASDARVLGHTTVGHTVSNSASRLYEGGEEGGNNLFNWCCLPVSSWMSRELEQMQASGAVSDPPQVLEQMVFRWFVDIVRRRDRTQLASRMNSDPELFRAELRLRIKERAQAQLLDWGIIPDGAIVRRIGAMDLINPTYRRWPRNSPKIPKDILLTLEGAPLDFGQGLMYPVTWDGDPHEEQAYLSRGWFEIILPPAGS